jgi:hypothetical protein
LEKAYLLEPDIENFNFMFDHTKYLNVERFNVGILYGGKKYELLPHSGNVGGFQVIESDTGGLDNITTLEDLNIPIVDLIKIDVEGFELSVLEGLRRTTEKYRPVVSFEYHGQSAAPGTFEAIKRCLSDYAIIEPVHAPESGFAKKLSWNVRNAGAPVFKAVKDPEPRTYDNILAVPPERLDRFCG